MGGVSRPWQQTEAVLERFSDRLQEERQAYREFILAAAVQGRRPDLMGGGLLRSYGGWLGVSALRRGREAYRSDERILGSSSFVARVLEEGEAQGRGQYKEIDLTTLIQRICNDMELSRGLLVGAGRNRAVSRARAVVSYVWTRYLGRSGRALAQELGVSPQAVYAAAGRVGRDIIIAAGDLERWCR